MIHAPRVITVRSGKALFGLYPDRTETEFTQKPIPRLDRWSFGSVGWSGPFSWFTQPYMLP